MRSGRVQPDCRQPPEARGEVVEDVLLVGEAAGVVPRLAVLPSPAERRDREQATPLHPGEPLRLEARPDRDVEATVAVQECCDVTGRGRVAVPGEEQRDAGSIVSDVTKTCSLTKSAGSQDKRSPPDLADGAIGHPHGEHDRRRDEGRECQEQLVVPTAPGHLDDRADPRQAYVGHGTAVEFEQRQATVGVVKVRRCQPITNESDVLQRLACFGDDFARLGRIVDVDCDHPAEGCIAVRDEVDRAVDGGDVFVPRVRLIEHGLHTRRLDTVVEIGDVDPTLRIRPWPDGDDQEAAVVGDLGLKGPLGLGGDREDQWVVAGFGPESVKAQLHVVVRGVVRRVGRGLGVAAVEEAGAVERPRRRGELAPLDPIGQLLTGVGATDTPGPPIGAGLAQGQCDMLARLVDGDRGQGRGPLPAQLIRVEEDVAFGVRRVGRPQHILILQTGVA